MKTTNKFYRNTQKMRRYTEYSLCVKRHAKTSFRVVINNRLASVLAIRAKYVLEILKSVFRRIAMELGGKK